MMNNHPFAAYELRRLAAAMNIDPCICLNVDVAAFDRSRFARFDPELDDAFTVRVKDGSGTITATNERALLMGVYHFFKLQGCRFFHPGKEGEYIPVTGKVLDCEETWYAYTRHRGTEDYGCNGGIDGILDIIDWLPKVMMNTFFMEHTSHASNMNVYHLHRDDPYRRPQQVTAQQHKEWDRRMIEACRQRHILLHSGGHGWTAMLMEGITELKSALEISLTNDTTPVKNPEILALLDGKRELLKGVPINTNLCLSQEAVRRRFVERVYAYSQQHPEITYLHVWLGDAFSNFCECENCRKISPTDMYIKLINEIDEEFTRHGSKQRLVFLAYFELLYPPVTQRINNPDRFTLLFCPYGRNFNRRYRDWTVQWAGPKPYNQYTRDDMHMGEYLEQLRQWKEQFHGDSLVFDYNLYDSASHSDLTNLAQTPIVTDDCLYLPQLDLNGRIECGDTRFMTPSPVIWGAMAQALFYGTALEEEAYYDDYLGKGQPVLSFLRHLREQLPQPYTRCSKEQLTAAKALVQDCRCRLFAHDPTHPFHRQHCEYTQQYLNLIELVLDILLEKLCDANGAVHRLRDLREAAFRLDGLLPHTFSAKSFYLHFRTMLWPGYEEN